MGKQTYLHLIVGFTAVILVTSIIMAWIYASNYYDCANNISPYCHKYVCPNGKEPVPRKNNNTCSALTLPC